jgi:hypothetical protein
MNDRPLYIVSDHTVVLEKHEAYEGEDVQAEGSTVRIFLHPDHQNVNVLNRTDHSIEIHEVGGCGVIEPGKWWAGETWYSGA